MNIEEAKLILNEILDNYFIRGEHLSTITSERKQAIETVLNMLKEQGEEISNEKRKNKELSNQILILLKEQDNYSARIEKKNAEIEKKDKIIDLMVKSIELQQYANIDTTNLDLICDEFKCNKKCKLVKEECIKQYFAGLVEKE